MPHFRIRVSWRSLVYVLLPGLFPLAAHADTCGLGDAMNWCVDQESAGLGTNELGDRFGEAVALGDFDGNGILDLAVGSPGEDGDRGRVYIFSFGGRSLGLERVQSFDQDDAGFDPADDGGAEVGDEFGAALAAGDFDGDGVDDLAIGSPGEDQPCGFVIRSCLGAGIVHVLHGFDGSGAAYEFAVVVVQDDVTGQATVDLHHFGATLHAGFLDSDTFESLIVAAPDAFEGQVAIFPGVSDFFSGGLAGVDGPPGDQGCTNENVEHGATLALQTMSGNERGVAVGAPACDIDSDQNGRIQVNLLELDQFHDFSPAGNGADDRFGESMAAGNFRGGAFDLVVAGAPYKDHGTGNPSDSGRVYVWSNQPSFVTLFGQNLFPGSTPEAGDRFGAELAAGDFDGDLDADLAIGSPGEEGSVNPANPGFVYILDGSASGLVPHSVPYHFSQVDLGGTNEANDEFGSVLATGDLEGDVKAELVIGVPKKDDGAVQLNSGKVYLTRRLDPTLLFLDGFEAGSTVNWSAAVN